MSYKKRASPTYDTIHVKAKIPGRFHDATFEFHNPIEPQSPEEMAKLLESRIDEEIQREKSEKETAEREAKREKELADREAALEAKKIADQRELDENFKKALENAKAEAEKTRERVRGTVDEEAVIRHAEAGESVDDIVRLFNITRSEVYGALGKHGIRLKKKRFGSDDVKQARKDLTESKLRQLGVDQEEEETASDQIRKIFPAGLKARSKSKSRSRRSTREPLSSSSLWEYELE